MNLSDRHRAMLSSPTEIQDVLLGALHQCLLANAANHENRTDDVAIHLDRVLSDIRRAMEGTAGDAT